jgi:hypothetical protein
MDKSDDDELSFPFPSCSNDTPDNAEEEDDLVDARKIAKNCVAISKHLSKQDEFGKNK